MKVKSIFGFLKEELPDDPLLEAAFVPVMDRDQFLQEDPRRLVVPDIRPIPETAVREFLQGFYPDPCEHTTRLQPANSLSTLPDLRGQRSWVVFREPVVDFTKSADLEEVELVVSAAKRHGCVLLPFDALYLLGNGCYSVPVKGSSTTHYYQVYYDPETAQRKLRAAEERRKKKAKKPPLNEALWSLDFGLVVTADRILGYPMHANAASSSLRQLAYRTLLSIQWIFLLHLERQVFHDRQVWRFFHEQWPCLKKQYHRSMLKQEVDATVVASLWEGLNRLEKLCPKNPRKVFRPPSKEVLDRLLLPAEEDSVMPRNRAMRLQQLFLAGRASKVSVVLAKDKETGKLFRGKDLEIQSVDVKGIRVGETGEYLLWSDLHSVRAISDRELWSWTNPNTE